MLSMKGISKVYRTAIVQTHALRELDLSVRAGEFVAVTGPSGSGKTTLLNIAGLLEDFSSGEYQLDGVAVSGPAWRRYLRFWSTDSHADLEDELRFHLESRVDEAVAASERRTGPGAMPR